VGRTPEPQFHIASSACVCGPKGTITKPLDGGTLYLVGNARAGEGNHDSAATLQPPSANLESTRLGCGGGERKKQRGGGGHDFTPAPLLLDRHWPADHRTRTTTATTAARGDARLEMWWERKDDTRKGHRGGEAASTTDLEAAPPFPMAAAGCYNMVLFRLGFWESRKWGLGFQESTIAGFVPPVLTDRRPSRWTVGGAHRRQQPDGLNVAHWGAVGGLNWRPNHCLLGKEPCRVR
jgi:hypothetical protein